MNQPVQSLWIIHLNASSQGSVGHIRRVIDSCYNPPKKIQEVGLWASKMQSKADQT